MTNKIKNVAFWQGISDELKKVSWPSRQQTFKLTFVVIIVSLIIGFYIGIIDILLAKVLQFVTYWR